MLTFSLMFARQRIDLWIKSSQFCHFFGLVKLALNRPLELLEVTIRWILFVLPFEPPLEQGGISTCSAVEVCVCKISQSL